MKHFNNKVAVITGAASGIGLALAEVAAREGMRLALADIEDTALAAAEAHLRSLGAETITVPTDVSKLEDVQALADKTLQRFGGAHLLFNNAGVASGSSIWETSSGEWDWVMGVNFWGVVHGIRVFVPIMLKQNVPGHIVNTASIAGLISYHPSAPYHVSKHAVVALSEQLHHALALQNAPVKTSVLCPGWVQTRILAAERNRPAAVESLHQTEQERIVREAFSKAVASGMSAEEVARQTFDAIRAERFYILPDPHWRKMMHTRMDDLLNACNPSSVTALNDFMNDPGAVARLAVNQWKERFATLWKGK